MDIDKEKQLKIIAQTNQLLHSTENQRMLLRFQRGVVDLENGRFEILRNSEFVEKFIDYLYTLYQKGPEQNIIKILDKIGFCACSANKELRERAVFILSIFADRISEEKTHPDFLEAVSRLLVNWLQIETEYLSGFHFICLQLQKILQKMLRMGLWYQAENLIIILSQIQKGVLPKNNLIRKTIGKVHSGLAEEPFLKNLVDIFLDKKEDRRDIAQCLLLHFGSKAAAVLVQSLIDCKEKEKRFTLIEFIPSTGKVALPVFDFCLKQNPPWYVIRNLVIIISRMEDPKLYEMVRPYLTHRDIRVQLQVLNCITKLGGPQMRDRLIEALAFINDELKQQVVVQLGNMGGKDVGNALCSLLERRGDLAMHVQDEVVLTLCTKIKFEPSERAITAVKDLRDERMQRFGEGDRLFQAAQDALVNMELKNTGSKAAGTPLVVPFELPAVADTFKVPVATEEEFDSLLKGSGPLEQEEWTPPPALAAVLQKEERQPVAADPNPPVVQGIIRDAEKNLSDPDSAIHFALWAKLYQEMTTAEFTAFHTALQRKTYQPEELIIARGDQQALLFFFDSGTVNLVRNQPGEEIHLSAAGAGDLIGSDVFLSGDPWNLSLYAREAVRAHIFDLENLMAMRVDFPQLAEKIFTFCAAHDVLQTLLRVLDDPDIAGTESTRLKRAGKSKKPANDKTQQGIILRKLRSGLCFTSPGRATEKIARLLGNQLLLKVRMSSGAAESRSATIVGTVRSTIRPGESILFVRFLQPLADTRYSCESIEFTESA